MIVSEYSPDPAVIALADLRMWVADHSVITPERALECVRIVSIELAERRMWWWPVMLMGIAFGALGVAAVLIVGGSHL